ncbi:CocE/NonD family hydrolase [Jannaschia sp. 2305UL9-9]|uniref:CocE/NonD family hydrolase n=1 Tax=Jannaschia sp. 2305UL9-9 TaxID=3121638 RepID=UPI0035285F03
MPDTVLTFEDHPVPLPDGTVLSARIWRPTGTAPAILEALPYRKRDGTAARDATTHALFAERGYACIRVDLRGAGESDGLFDDEYSETELSDIEAIIAWIADQPWCSGAVGMMGISWGGFNGLQVAVRQPPALRAIISSCSSVDRFADDIHYKGGCQLSENIGWAAVAMSWLTMPPDPALRPDWRRIWQDRLEAAPFLAETWTSHQTRDAYWRHGSVCEDYAALGIPVLSLGGWHDGYRNTPFRLLANRPDQTRALVGPWNHKYPHLATPGPRLDFVEEAIAWWDRHLAQEPGPDLPAARLYLMDGIAPATSYDHRPGRWLSFPEWPCRDIRAQAFHLTDGGLSRDPAPLSARVTTDPLHGEGCGEFFPFGFGPGELPDDQRADDARASTFDSGPLAAPLAIVGAPRIDICLTPDRDFGQLVVRLCDVAPDGSSHLVTNGLLNLALADDMGQARPPRPGHAMDVSLSLDHIAYVVPRGHRLRISISTSYWPFAWPERGDVTLLLTAGSVALPILADPEAYAITIPEDVPPTSPSHRSLTEGREEKRRYDADGLRHLEIIADRGATEDLSHGLITANSVRELWSIDTGNAACAQARIEWTRSLTRDGVTASSKVVHVMRSDETHWHIDATLEAFVDDEPICQRAFHTVQKRAMI